LGIKLEQRYLLDDLAVLSRCDGRDVVFHMGALRQDGEVVGASLLEAHLPCLYKPCLLCSDGGKDFSLDKEGTSVKWFFNMQERNRAGERNSELLFCYHK